MDVIQTATLSSRCIFRHVQRINARLYLFSICRSLYECSLCGIHDNYIVVLMQQYCFSWLLLVHVVFSKRIPLYCNVSIFVIVCTPETFLWILRTILAHIVCYARRFYAFMTQQECVLLNVRLDTSTLRIFSATERSSPCAHLSYRLCIYICKQQQHWLISVMSICLSVSQVSPFVCLFVIQSLCLFVCKNISNCK